MSGDVLTISSQVIHGSVGNRATEAVFRHYGFRVWALPTVLMPWHPGHGAGAKIITPADDFDRLIDDLIKAPKTSVIKGLITGYLGSVDQAKAIGRLVDHLRNHNRQFTYLCDPVMGDHGRLYIGQDTAKAISDILVPKADIITPNPFELAWLTGMAVDRHKMAIAAAQKLKPKTVIQTSVIFPDENQTGFLWMGDDAPKALSHPAFANAPNGLGDMFGAIVLAKYLQGYSAQHIMREAGALIYGFAASSVDLDMLPLNDEMVWRKALGQMKDFWLSDIAD